MDKIIQPTGSTALILQIQQLELLVGQFCHDIENADKNYALFFDYDIPAYAKQYWRANRDRWYKEKDKADRYAQYLKLKEEFGKLKNEFEPETYNISSASTPLSPKNSNMGE